MLLKLKQEDSCSKNSFYIHHKHYEVIGRIEPVLTKEQKLEIRGCWPEDINRWDKKVWDAFSEGLETFKKYPNATEVSNLAKLGSY